MECLEDLIISQEKAILLKSLNKTNWPNLTDINLNYVKPVRGE